jgi:hypothetical protein
MAQAQDNSGNWIWWTLGGVALLGLGVGSYFFFSKNGNKDKNKKNEDDKKPATNTVVQEKVVYRDRPASTTTTTTTSTGNPFQNKADLEKFQQWVKDNKSWEYNIGKVDGLWGSKSRGAWEKYKAFYEYELNKGTQQQQQQQQANTWSNSDYGSNTELKALLEGGGQDVARKSDNSLLWYTKSSLPRVLVKFYDGGLLTIEKVDKNGKYYGKGQGTWAKTLNSSNQPIFRFNANNKNYDANYDSASVINNVYAIMKANNYYSPIDGSFVPFSADGNNDMDIFSMNGGEIILGGGSTSSVQDSLL